MGRVWVGGGALGGSDGMGRVWVGGGALVGGSGCFRGGDPLSVCLLVSEVMKGEQEQDGKITTVKGDRVWSYTNQIRKARMVHEDIKVIV